MGRIKIKQPAATMPAETLDNVFQMMKRWIETLPLFSELETDQSHILKYARQFRLFKDVVVFGVGGSCLGGRLLSQFKPFPGTRIHFVDNIDASSWNALFSQLNINQTGMLAISKSGNTTETLCQVLTFLQTYKEQLADDSVVFISDTGNNALRGIASEYSIPCLDHPAGIGGRFSIFTIVGLLPALISGIDVPALIQGAKESLTNFMQMGPDIDNPILTSAAFFDAAFKQGCNISVQFCYADRLIPFSAWYNQLWAESLGKRSMFDDTVRYGMTPVTALGTVDQHSQLQLYMDGPQDKVFTFFTLGDHPETKPIEQNNLQSPIVQAINSHTLAELMVAHQNVTLQTLMQNQCAVRRIHIPVFDEESLGELLMFSILEVLSIGCLWGINPFDQPGVKNGKERVMEMLNTP